MLRVLNFIYTVELSVAKNLVWIESFVELDNHPFEKSDNLFIGQMNNFI